jgi:hypothetical protein
MVTYGDLYLRQDGSWSTVENIISFFCSDFNKFFDTQLTARQPSSGTPTTGMDFKVRVYHAYTLYSEFTTLADLKDFPNGKPFDIHYTNRLPNRIEGKL